MRVATGSGAGRQVNVHARVRAGIIRGIEARTAVKNVGPGAAGQDVIAVAADERVVSVAAIESVVAAAADQHVVARVAAERVAKPGADKLFDMKIDVALRVASPSEARFEIGDDEGVRCRVVDGIESGAAVDILGARAGINQVIAGAGGDIAAARAGMDDVISAAGSNDVMTIASPDDIIAVASIDGVASVTRPENLIQAVADEQIIFRRAVQLAAVNAEHRTLDEPDSLEPAI